MLARIIIKSAYRRGSTSYQLPQLIQHIPLVALKRYRAALITVKYATHTYELLKRVCVHSYFAEVRTRSACNSF